MATKQQTRLLRLLREAVKKRSYILRISDVLGYGVGFRERNGEWTDEPALIVYVCPGRKAKKYEDMPRHQRIPSRIRLKVGKKTIWLPVDIVETETGKLMAGNPATASLDKLVSIGHQNEPDRTGSIGWIARRNSPNRELVLCTALHALVDLKSPLLTGAQVEKTYRFDDQRFDNIVNPSRLDNGHFVNDIVGFMVAGRRSNLVDVGVVQITDLPWVRALIERMGAFREPHLLTEDEIDSQEPIQVSILGRTSRRQSGVVKEFPAQHTFEYSDRKVILFNLIATDIATRKGDSGALLFDSERRPLGMLVGAAGDRSFFINIARIIEIFDLTGAI